MMEMHTAFDWLPPSIFVTYLPLANTYLVEETDNQVNQSKHEVITCS